MSLKRKVTRRKEAEKQATEHFKAAADAYTRGNLFNSLRQECEAYGVETVGELPADVQASFKQELEAAGVTFGVAS